MLILPFCFCYCAACRINDAAYIYFTNLISQNNYYRHHFKTINLNLLWQNFHLSVSSIDWITPHVYAILGIILVDRECVLQMTCYPDITLIRCARCPEYFIMQKICKHFPLNVSEKKCWFFNPASFSGG